MGARVVTMISPTGQSNSSSRHAFTLIELILVLGLLAAVLAITAPSLARFFGGRALAEETRRFVALTEHGSNQAINEGVPMVLWIEEDLGEYGLRPELGYPTNRYNSFRFHVHEDLALEIESSALNQLNTTQTPSILFLPDGSISENSLYSVLIKDRQEGMRRIAQTYNRLSFEVRDKQYDQELLQRP